MDMMRSAACIDLMCQHPSCWNSRRQSNRRQRVNGKHHSRITPADEIELPTQKIMNMLAEFGPDPADRYPTDDSLFPIFKCYPAETSNGCSNGDSCTESRGWAPHATPASPHAASSVTGQPCTGQLSTGQPSTGQPSTGQPDKMAKDGQRLHLSMVQVQEVFDLSDLRANYVDTFSTRPCYVWVPRPTASDSQVEAQKLSPAFLKFRDLTEDMMPLQLGAENSFVTKRVISSRPSWLRRSNTLRSAVRHYVSPATPSGPQVSPLTESKQHLGEERSVCKETKDSSLRHHQPHRLGKQRAKHYNTGVHQLLELPPDIVAELLSQLCESDLCDEKMFTAALLRTLRKAAAAKKNVFGASTILQQRKVALRHTSEKSECPPASTNQVLWQHMLEEKDAELPVVTSDDVPISTDKPVTLPPITASGSTKSKENITSISLSLPDLPPGARGAKPFCYQNKSIDFSLGRIAAPLPSTSSFVAPEWLSSVNLSKPSRQVVEDAIESATHGTSLQRQMTTDSNTSYGNYEATSRGVNVSLDNQLTGQLTGLSAIPHEAASAAEAARLTMSRDLTGMLGTIVEGDSDQCMERSTIAPRSRLSVRFADNVLAVAESHSSLDGGAGLTDDPGDPPQRVTTPGGLNVKSAVSDALQASPCDVSSSTSAKAKLLIQGAPSVSPAPPPPSPEPKEGHAGATAAAQVNNEATDCEQDEMLNAFLDSDSELNLSARPPSTLDDISRINTPIPTPSPADVIPQHD